MKDKNICLKPETFQLRLSEKLFRHRKDLNLTQREVADLLDKSETTYQRWESTGKCLTDIYDILKVFQALNFSIIEIMELLELPRPNMEDLEKLCPNEDIQKKIENEGVCFYVRNNCANMDSLTISMLLKILSIENLKRQGGKQIN